MDKTVLRAELGAILNGIAVPPPSLAAIRRKMNGEQRSRRFHLRPLSFAAAAAALVVICAPLTSRSVVLSLEARIAQLLHWTPPPAPPKTLLAGMNSSEVTPAQAQSRVTFTVQPPSGLPAGVMPAGVVVVPRATYSYEKKAWARDANALQFSYMRSDGRRFELIASAYDPAAPKPGKYIFNADLRDANGLPRRYERFVWRNGNQEMSAVDEGISASEIAAIRTAMHGEPIATVWPPPSRSSATMIILKKP